MMDENLLYVLPNEVQPHQQYHVLHTCVFPGLYMYAVASSCLPCVVFLSKVTVVASLSLDTENVLVRPLYL